VITNLNTQNNNIIYLRRSLACIYIQIRLCLTDKEFSVIGNKSKDICDVLKSIYLNKDEKKLSNHEINLIGMISDYILKHQEKKIKKIDIDTAEKTIKWFSSFLRSKYPKEIKSNSVAFNQNFLNKIIDEAKFRMNSSFEKE